MTDNILPVYVLIVCLPNKTFPVQVHSPVFVQHHTHFYQAYIMSSATTVRDSTSDKRRWNMRLRIIQKRDWFLYFVSKLSRAKYNFTIISHTKRFTSNKIHNNDLNIAKSRSDYY